jgi:hypothetical protein
MKYALLLGIILVLSSHSAKSQSSVVKCSDYVLNTNRDSLTLTKTTFQVLDLKFISGTQTISKSKLAKTRVFDSALILSSLIVIDDALRKKNAEYN